MLRYLSRKTQSEQWTNKKPSLNWCVSCAIQNGSKLCHSNSVSFDAKKAKETLGIKFRENTFFCKREHLLEIHQLSVKVKSGKMDECQELNYMKEIYVTDLLPKRISSIILKTKWQKFTGVLTLNPTWRTLSNPIIPTD